MREDNLSVLFLSSEVYPFAKTGGLADVAGSLPKALSEKGCRVCVMLPLYKKIFSENFALEKLFEIEVPMGDEVKKGIVYKSFLDPGRKIPAFLIWQKEYFDRENLYGDEYGDFPDNAERFSFFCRAALSILPRTGYKFQIIHCNDWQTALVPLYLKHFFSDQDYYKGIGTLFTIHNLAYQGIFPREKLRVLGLGEEFFTFTRLEFWGKINLMKAGLIYADVINTVSPTYSREIQTPDFGFGLDGVLRERKKDLYGILNGI
ncbi:glycogen synthase, partial [Candidatus Aerophobetes bacterium]|nr:glycogen synthase [Candidatus Aerophobetes bacterium]